MNSLRVPFFLFLIFFVTGIATITHYGINWDEPAHFMRGQAFLRFLILGKKDYAELPEIDGKSYIKDYGYEFVDKATGSVIRRSIYQHWERGLMYYTEDIEKRGSHPAFSDILAAFSNYIFFITLGIAPDIFSYNYYIVLMASLLVGGIYFFVRRYFGPFAAIVSSLSLALFPVFWAESHNNVKDIPQAVFFSFAIFSLYAAFTTKKIRYVLLFALWGAFAFSTKFNFVFIVPIAVTWFIFRWLFFYRTNRIDPMRFFKKNKRFFLSFLLVPIIIVVIWIGTFPAMWFEPKLIPAAFSYYKTTGTAISTGINPYALQYLLFTTPPVILLFSIVGVVGGFFLAKKIERDVILLVVVWFLIPILRVTMPNTVIYGGVRQIMEYIPALAILSGIGAHFLVVLVHRWLTRKKIGLALSSSSKMLHFLQLFVLVSFIPLVLTLVRLHPNEGVYFNTFIGGLSGAKERDFPDWGQTLGNPHRQGITWINEHVEKGAKLSLDFELWSNLPHIWVRNDILYDSRFKSGTQRQGEYVMSVTNKSEFLNWFRFKDLDTFVEPVHQVAVDGVPLLKIWKNDVDHIKAEYKNMEEEKLTNVSLKKEGLTFTVTLPNVRKILRIEFVNDDPNLCNDFNDYVGNINLYRSKLAKPTAVQASAYDFNDKLTYRKPFFQFTGEEAKVIVVNIAIDHPCYSTIKAADVVVIKK